MSFRYQIQTLYAEKKGVKTFEGVDPITGLPVLIYEFQGDPRTNLERLESENIPGILEIDRSSLTRLVVAYSKRYKAVTKPFRIAKSMLLIESARALRDAARAGIVHGDIRPERFLSTQDHVLLEGFGIPWIATENPYRAPETKGANFKDDIYAWAKSILDIVSGELSDAHSALLTQCLVANPNERLDAESLYESLNHLGKHDAIANKTSVHNFELSFDENSMTNPGFQEATVPASLVNAARSGGAAVGKAQVLEEKAKPPEEEKTFIKNLPPGAVYKTGESYSGPDQHRIKLEQDLAELRSELAADNSGRRRRTFMIVGLIVAVLLLAGLALYRPLLSPRTSQAQASNLGSVTQYIVVFNIEPTDLPPVDIIVVSSPEGSARPDNSLLGRYRPGSNQIALNKEGVWQFQGRFEDRLSEVVSLQLPEQRSLNITIPPAPEAETDSEN
ncbi:MAG: protein kinase family protein [Trueperaceae bacterium]|nr:protein kinase family protein [Trueperaceae bacterium]